MQLAFVPREASPIRRQYLALKREHPDAILFFQLGDFYETFEDDARVVSEVCEVALTSREMGRGERLPMAGVPVHAVEAYIGRLVERGYHVALCRQVEDPSVAATRGGSSIVRREIIRVITPGTLVDPALLPAGRANLLGALAIEGQRSGIAFADINTGEFACGELVGIEHAAAVRAELFRLELAECLVVDATAAPLLPAASATTEDPSLFLDPEGTLCAHFGVGSLAALGLGERPAAARAAAAVVRYASRTNPQAVSLLRDVRVYDPTGHMILDPTTRDHLELARSLRGRREGSLLHTLDHTRTPMGARLLAAWLGRPLLDRAAIERRLESVTACYDSDALRAALHGELAGLPDLERLAGRTAQRLLLPREALALARGIEGAAAVDRILRDSSVDSLADYLPILAVPPGLAEEIRSTLTDDPSPVFGEDVIRSGCSEELDDLKSQSTDGRQWLLDLERRERERTGARTLKVGYNRIFGYYIEVSSAVLSQQLDYYRRQETGATTVADLLDQLGYQRRQTVASGERFVVPELRDYETRQARSAARMAELERELYDALVARAASEAPSLIRAGRALAELDVLASFAEVSRQHGYTRPELCADPVTQIVGGRHPVVERALGWSVYIPNGASLQAAGAGAATAPSVIVLTGPNMAGKTTYGRMVLLVSLLAQVGCFVPAEHARLGLVDRLFLRSGASDDIAGGQSTFMVEMVEAAAILRGATSRSLAFFDEVGRGTSTYDGMAIARAIVEFLATSPEHGCRAVFSTHYHELADLEKAHANVHNFCMEVHEAADQVTFTYRVVPGSADRSYGVHVARLAGLPPSVVGRAEEVLAELERGPAGRETGPAPGTYGQQRRPPQVVYDLASADVDRMSPIEALNLLARLRAAAQSVLQTPNSAPAEHSASQLTQAEEDEEDKP